MNRHIFYRRISCRAVADLPVVILLPADGKIPFQMFPLSGIACRSFYLFYMVSATGKEICCCFHFPVLICCQNCDHLPRCVNLTHTILIRIHIDRRPGSICERKFRTGQCGCALRCLSPVQLLIPFRDPDASPYHILLHFIRHNPAVFTDLHGFGNVLTRQKISIRCLCLCYFVCTIWKC